MNLASTIYALRWLVRDTFRQAITGKVFWIMLGVSALAIVFCLGVSMEGGTVVDEGEVVDVATGKALAEGAREPGRVSFLFGALSVSMHRGPAEEVRLIHLRLATFVAGMIGLLLALVWTAGLVPDFLQPSSAVVLLAKPAPRWLFLLGKYLGVVLFVAVQSLIFFAGTWAALGIRTGVWNNLYLVGWPMLVFQFAVFFSVSLVIAVTTRSTVACVFGIVLFWAIAMGINFGRYAVNALPHLGKEAREPSAITRVITETGYWVMPKPYDYMVMLDDLLVAHQDRVSVETEEMRIAKQSGLFQPFAALAVSIVFLIAMILLAGYQLTSVEY